MSLVASPDTAYLRDIKFSNFPEMDFDPLAPMAARAEVRRRIYEDDFAGFVVRSGGEAFENVCIEALEAESTNGKPVKRLQFVLETDAPIHSDPFRSPAPYKTTIHRTETGETDVIVLPGAKVFTIGDSLLRRRETTKLLFDKNILDSSRLSMPSLALRGIMAAGDVLVLNRSQLHAFRSKTPDRLSIGHDLQI